MITPERKLQIATFIITFAAVSLVLTALFGCASRSGDMGDPMGAAIAKRIGDAS